MAKTRIRRKDLKKPDEFVAQTGKALAWLSERYQLVAAALGALLLAGLVIAFAGAFRSARNRDANSDLALAMASLRGEDLANAKTALTGVAERWGNTPVGELATLLAANTQIRLGETDDAIALLSRLMADASDDLPTYLRQQALYAWGSALEQKSDWAAAASKYQEAANLTGPYSAQAVVAEARVREQLGENERAAELYRKLYDQYPEFPDRELVRSKIDV